jgi:hypothetical protein
VTALQGARFALALCVTAALVQLIIARLIETGLRGGPAGVFAALTLGGFAVAIAFTAIYNGPRRLWRLVSRRPVPTIRP